MFIFSYSLIQATEELGRGLTETSGMAKVVFFSGGSVS
jgi:hypothetical protein